MLLNNIKPAKSLERFVRFYRIIHFDFREKQSETQTAKMYRPRIEHCLQFTPFDREEVYHPHSTQYVSESVALFGQSTSLTKRCVGKHFLNFQIVFHPSILYDVLRQAASDLTNVYTSADVFLGNSVFDVNEQLSSCTRYDQMVRVVEKYLLKILNSLPVNSHPINKISQQMSNPYDLKPIEWYANQSNLCYRQFDRIFKSYTGISPQEYRNLVRLDLAYLLKNRSPERDWLSIALESGFYDYQHLSKNYKKYTGYSPVSFYELEKKAPERYFGDFEK